MIDQASLPHNDEYLKYHPNAIVDPVKALYMAHGTKELEVAANNLGKQAFEATMLESMSAGAYAEYAGITPEEAQAQQDAVKDQDRSSKLSVLATGKRRETDEAARKIARGYDTHQYARGRRQLP